MNSSFDVASSKNSSFRLGNGKSPTLHGKYGYAMPIAAVFIIFINVIGMILVKNSKTIFKNLQVYIISLMACYFSIGVTVFLAPIVFLLINSTSALDLFASIGRSFVTSSLLHTAALSIDRLLSVKKPNFYTLRITTKTCIGVCVCIWSVSTLYNILANVLFPFYLLGGQFDVRVYSSFVVVYFSCLTVYIGSSRSIIVCAREHIRRADAAPWLDRQPRDQQNLATFRLSIVITTASGFLFILYLPSQMFALLTFFDPDLKLNVTLFFQIIAYPSLFLESLLGPLLYLLRFRETRQMIRRLCCFSTRNAANTSRTNSGISTISV